MQMFLLKCKCKCKCFQFEKYKCKCKCKCFHSNASANANAQKKFQKHLNANANATFANANATIANAFANAFAFEHNPAYCWLILYYFQSDCVLSIQYYTNIPENVISCPLYMLYMANWQLECDQVQMSSPYCCYLLCSK